MTKHEAERRACAAAICHKCANELPLDADYYHPRLEASGKPGARRVKCRAAAIHARTKAGA